MSGRMARARAPHIDAGEQEQPHNVDEMPIPGAELKAEVLMNATKVSGVFDSDPMTNPNAVKYERLTYMKVLNDRLDEVLNRPALRAEFSQ